MSIRSFWLQQTWSSNDYYFDWSFQIYRLRRLFLFACLQSQPNHLAFKALQMKGNFLHLYWQLDLERWHANRITTMKTSIQTSFATKSFQTRFKCYLFTQMNHSFSTSISLELLLNNHALFRFNIIVRLMAIGLSVLRVQKKKRRPSDCST